MTTDAGDTGPLDAGDFAVWRRALRHARRSGGAIDVPCGTCTACCTSSQFVHVDPDEHDALAHIPAELLFPAPGLPEGHVLLGYDEHGRCPMLIDDACSIYAHRPRTCRTYDCRVFPGTGLVGEPTDKPAIAARAARWRFRTDGPGRHEQEAAATAVTFLTTRRAELPPGSVPSNPTQLAVVALEVADLFAADAPTTGTPPPAGPAAPTPEVVAQALRRLADGADRPRDGDG